MSLNSPRSPNAPESQSLPGDNDETVELDLFIAPDSPPVHPIPRMQGAFNESIMESTESPESSSTTHADEYIFPGIDAEARRQQLLELEDFSDKYSSRWRQKPGAKFHPLWKLIAQISFGVHLLQQSLAKSDEEVLRILQIHVDEVDGFLEDTTADFELAIVDVHDRVNFLRLPLEHGDTFNNMLKDKNFRTAIVEGNDIIDRIIDRTTRAMNNSMLDITKGIDATAELAKFLERLGADWTKRDEKLLEIYDTMRGNAEGWYRTFRALESKGERLNKHLTELGFLSTEMSRRAGAVSRRHTMKASRHSSKSSHPKTSPTHSESRSCVDSHVDKPLPPDPLQKLLSMSPTMKEQSPTQSPDKSRQRSRHNSSTERSPSGSERPPRKSSSRPREVPQKLQHSRHPTPPLASISTSPSPTKGLSPASPASPAKQSRQIPVELPAEGISSELDTKYSTLIPAGKPQTASQNVTRGTEITATPRTPDPVSAIESIHSSDMEPIENPTPQSRQSSEGSSSVTALPGCPPPPVSTVSPLPQFPSPTPSNGKWSINGKKSFASMRGIFNKKRPLKESHMAILV